VLVGRAGHEILYWAVLFETFTERFVERMKYRSTTIKISKSMMKIGNVTALPSVYCDYITNMSWSIMTTPNADRWY